ncbi:MAG: hypothetical protein EA001_13430 [Oscillatoriales cyanobacterium]|nr:MAG: hypothetical protein EA001_13430 [Oscillatoriales cyanobacterium]
MERHHEARQAAQQAFLEALEQLREDLISGAESEEAALVTSAAPLAPAPNPPPPTPATIRSPASTLPPQSSANISANITFEDLEAAIEDIEQYMHWQERAAAEVSNPEEPDAIATGQEEPIAEETPIYPAP